MPVLCGDCGAVLGGNADYVLYLLACTRSGVGGGQVYLVDDGNNLQIVVYREIGIRKRLRLDALRGVNDEQRALAGVAVRATLRIRSQHDRECR